MEKTYRSKIGLELVTPIAAIIGTTFGLMLFFKIWAGAIIVGLVAVLILHMFSTTYYTISGNTLRIKSGFIINIVVDIGSISKITPTRNMLSSPALSLDRLEIFYNKYDSVLISPDDKIGFAEQLKSLNAGISITDDLNR